MYVYVYMYICIFMSIYAYISKLTTVVESDPNAPFSIATTL